MKKHHWKRLFFLLLGINTAVLLFLFVFLAIMLKSPSEETKIPKQNTVQNDVFFQIKTNKQDLNRVIDHYLEEEFSVGFDYEVLLTDEVELYGTLPVFSSNVDVKLTFEPYALENGDLELRQKNISVGQWNLPVPIVLKLVQNNYSLPEWVTIQPNEEKVYVSLQDLKLKSDSKVRVDEFNLKNDQIIFSLQLPMD
ncbi:YpmS family protein [Bacillus sp. V3B]|uniref:YpmS family protein n=1 Tax=Bacillus sp. V3B TaxID=2804915 RepID=UPI00210EB166|nr:YpmS family protein [Bacillus sp. V3B]